MVIADGTISAGKSKIFEGYRAIGLVTDDTPFQLSVLGSERFLLVSTGKAFQVYNCEKLAVSLVSPQTPQRIRSIAAKGSVATFTACGKDILVWERTKLRQSVGSAHTKPISMLKVIGEVLISLAGRSLKVWDISLVPKQAPEFANEFTLPSDFSVSAMVHPDTYLNKILLGSEEGGLQLWNIRKGSCIYNFESCNTTAGTGWLNAPVRALVQSPVIDVVGIGLGDGRLVLHNLKYDETLMTLRHTTEGAVTAISFRTDSGSSTPVAVSGSESGDILVWDLEGKKLQSVIREAHEGRVVHVAFLPNEPILVSSGVDNSIKMWIFDNLDGSARLLKSREGHKAPPTKIRYYGGATLATLADGSDGTSLQILSAGQDRAFRVFHTVRDQQSKEMSQGPLLKKTKTSFSSSSAVAIKKGSATAQNRERLGLGVSTGSAKLPPISAFAAAETRERDWCNVITCHADDPTAYIWNFENRVIGKHALRQFNPSKAAPEGSQEAWSRVAGRALSVAISACGHFGLVGTAGGAIFKYNMQSGQPRGSFPKVHLSSGAMSSITGKRGLADNLLRIPEIDTREQEAREKARDAEEGATAAHGAAVYGLVVDALNRHVISGSMDGTLKFWDFQSHHLVATVDVGSPVSQIELHRASGLLAVVCDDHVVRVYDTSTRNLVRRFSGHSHHISDVCFTPDARWIVTASLDSTVRVWDLPSGRCLDWLRFRRAVTGLSISPSGEFLATSHVDNVGIFLWANRAMFTDVFLDSSPSTPIEMDLPGAKSMDASGSSHIEEEVNQDTEGKSMGFPAIVAGEKPNDGEELKEKINPKSIGAATLSTLPPTMWQSLMNLELIKARNKPKAPPKAPEKAPFFLPTLHSHGTLQPAFISTASGTRPLASEATEDNKTLPVGWGNSNDDETWGTADGENGTDAEGDTEEEDRKAGSSRLLVSSSPMDVTSRCKLAALLSSALSNPEERAAVYNEITTFLSSLGASGVDVEMQSICLGDYDDSGMQLLGEMLQYFCFEIKKRERFELIQSYLHRFLFLYSSHIAGREDLLASIDALRDIQQASWRQLQELLHHNMCLIRFFSKLE